MKIALVRQTKSYQLNMVTPIGFIHLASYLRNTFDNSHNVIILDNRLEHWPATKLLEQTLAMNPDVVGVTAMTHEVPETLSFLEDLTKIRPDVVRIAGGVHATAEPDRFLLSGLCHYTILGEGEETFAELINALHKGQDPRGIRGLAWCEKNDDTVHRAPFRPLIEDLDSLPPADYGFIDVSRYFGWPSGDNLFHRPEHVGFITSRGCPFRCGYCHNMFGHNFRPHSPERVIRDLCGLVHEHGVREIHFWDDVFNLQRDRTLAICEGMVSADLDLTIAFPNGLRIELMDEQVLDALIRAGMKRISYGIESGDLQTLQAMKRYGNLKKVEEVVKLTVKRGVLTKGLFILGAPGETEKQMENTVRLALSLPLHYVSFNRFIPLPSAPLGRDLLKQFEKPPTWDDYNYEFSDLNVSAVSNRELMRIIRKANRRFYLRPKVIVNLFRLFPFRRRLLVMYLTWSWGYMVSLRRRGSQGMGLMRWIWSRIGPPLN